MDDLSLLRDYADTGSSRAFAGLVERHVDLVYSAALRRIGGDSHRAADITQMVFIDLARKAGKLRDHPLLAAWLHQSTRWAAATMLRGERRRQFHERAAATELVSGPVAEEMVNWEKLRPLLDDALDQLRETDRPAVLLRFFSNLPFAEIAARFGIGENAARMRVERALEKLHRALIRHGITSSSAALALAISQHGVTVAPAHLAATLTSASVASAAASGSGAGLGTALTNFLMTKLFLGLAAVVAMILTIGLSLEFSARTTARGELMRIRQQRDTRQSEVAKLSAQAAVSHQALRALPALPPETPPNPIQIERKRLDLIIRKGELDGEYASLFRRLKLDPATLDSLKALLVQRAQAIYDANQVLKEEKVTLASDAENQELERAATQTIDRQIAGLLGAQKFSEFDHYLSTKRYSFLLPEAWKSDDPELQTRANRLIELFTEDAPDFFDQPYRSGVVAWQSGGIPDTFLAEAKPLLSEENYQGLIAMNQQGAAWARMQEIARAAAYAGKLKLSKSSGKIYGEPKIEGNTPADTVR
jgi:RNA polymerase sigma factor (sigma-70 family)